LGKTKSKRQNGSNDQSQKKRRDYRCRTQEAFSIDESSMGGKTESRSQDEINLPGASLRLAPPRARQARHRGGLVR